MQVKCYLAEGNEVDQSMMELMALARGNKGHTGLGALTNDLNGISLSKKRSALILVGGRQSIHDFLINSGGIPNIIGTRPFLVSFGRKHRVLGKNETCVKIVCGGGHRQPPDGSAYKALGATAGPGQLLMNPVELAHCLHFMYGWG